MVIQVHWIRSDMMIRKVNFERDVTDAGSEVVRKLEMIDLSAQYEKRMQIYSNPGAHQSKLDSINRTLMNEMQSITSQRELEIFINKFFMSRDLVEDMYLPQQLPASERIKENLLDSLLNMELNQRGVGTEFEYAIYNPFKGEIKLEKTGNHTSELLDFNKAFRFELFPQEMHSSPDFLILYFPEERSFLLGQMWRFLGVSIFFILLIILVFAFTMMTIYRQRRLSEMKTDFFNNMTHEFKTPVSTISLACEALMDKDIQKSDDLYINYIKMIQEENRRLGYMAEMVLQSASLEKGELVLRKEKSNIHEVLDEVIRNIGIQVEIKDGEIVKDFKAENPDIELDKMHMTNVFHNLLDNANKYSPVKPHIIVSTKSNANELIIWVRDSGIGISKANQKKIFDKLYRVPAGNLHNFKGFGLGLSYVKSIVEKHGGIVKLDSELNKGTTFEISLPIQ
jgi:two-component system phosphate regulon sensor histidine kinase PhoR